MVLADTKVMRTLPTRRLGVLGKVLLANSLLLLALAGLVWLSLETSSRATEGAEKIHEAFSERVATDRALTLAVEDTGLLSERLLARQGAVVDKLDRRLSRTGPRLAAAIGSALDGGNGVKPAEERVVKRLHLAYPAYLGTRERILRRQESPGPGGRGALEVQLKRASSALRRELEAYAAIHLEEGDLALNELRHDGKNRDELLALLLGFALISLFATVWIARGIVRRLREYAAFSAVVAGGDLAPRLNSQRRDELGTLARSLNQMVEQLTSAAVQRQKSQEADRTYRSTRDAFSEILQVAETEDEAHDILKLHIQRGLPDSEVVVLNRNNSEDRLEATTELPEGSPLLRPLQSAEPRSCLAVRLAHSVSSDPENSSLLQCEICGATAKPSTCLPLLVSGEVIGSVLVNHPEPLASDEERQINESVAQAAPILANLRNLALAEARAATDALTGLPNRRAIQDTLKRMMAQSERTMAPLAVVMIDLDHFKQINDILGHEKGDAVLAAVGAVLSDTMRTSDFIGRNGGEEFIALLSDTDGQGALAVAEKLRAAIETIRVRGVERSITASLGVAIHPKMAADPETLVRLADRALYAAKNGGRNRVELASTPPSATVAIAAR